MEQAPVALVSVEDSSHQTTYPALNRWNLDGIMKLCEWGGVKVAFGGTSLSVESSRTAVVIAENNHAVRRVPAPEEFRVLAVMTAYNEGDVIRFSLQKLISQGIDVYLIDNWSDDNTIVEAERFLNSGLIAIERYPPTGPSGRYPWQGLLERVSDIATKADTDWTIHHDADEVRKSPWRNMSLRDGLYHVDRCGFNAVDHSVITFSPTDNSFVAGTDFERHLKMFRFGTSPTDLVPQVKAWKNIGIKPDPHEGGHDFRFLGRRVYPFNFLIKHYPIRSQSHGLQKVFRDRKPRWSPEERQMGWHIQYDPIAPGHSFLEDPVALESFQEKDFSGEHLFERLFRIVPAEAR
jgi:glycosyltransferase involved in cell wall biosynthesis